MHALVKIFDCILLSLCWVSACIPIVTIGVSCGSLYRTVYHCIRRDEDYPLKYFWVTFRENVKKGILSWLPVMIVFGFLIADAIILRAFMSQGKPLAQLYGITLTLIAVALVWAAYCSAYCVRFEGRIRDILWLSFYLVLSHPIMTIVIFLFIAMGVAISLLVPFLVIILPAAICLAITFPMETVFLKHMRPEDVEKIQNGEA